MLFQPSVEKEFYSPMFALGLQREISSTHRRTCTVYVRHLAARMIKCIKIIPQKGLSPGSRHYKILIEGHNIIQWSWLQVQATVLITRKGRIRTIVMHA